MMASYISRTVRTLSSAQISPQWGGHSRIIDPGNEKFDPCLILIQHEHKFRAGEVTGFPPHPHRGFETVTYCLDGAFDHGDSNGNSGRYGEGDVQWMTAGKGILHSEMFVTKEKEAASFHGFQLWLNLPQRLKMTTPAYQMLFHADIPVVRQKGGTAEDNSRVEGNDASIRIIAGRIGATKAPVEKAVPLSYFHVKLEPGSTWFFQLPKEHHALMYVISGAGKLGPTANSKPIKQHEYALFNEDGDQTEISNSGSAVLDFLFLEGHPFNEPIANQGPFVMNTKQELRQAAVDYQLGLFGTLEKPFLQEEWAKKAFRG